MDDGAVLDLGYVYFMRLRNTEKVKIGYSKDLKSRLLSFKTALIQGITLDGCIHSDKYKEIEKKIHLELFDKNIGGEWFSLSIQESSEIILRHAGTSTFCNIDEDLVIDGGVINYTSANQIGADYYPIKIMLYKKIHDHFKENHKLNAICATITDVKKCFLYKEDVPRSVLKNIMLNMAAPPTKIKKYTFNGRYLTGRPFVFSRGHFDKPTEEYVTTMPEIQESPFNSVEGSVDRIVI